MTDPTDDDRSEGLPARRKGDTEVFEDDDTQPSARPGGLVGLSQFLVDGPDPMAPPARLEAPPLEGDDGLAGVVLADRYRLEFELGRGGMGAVWVAEHLTLRTPIAVKVMLENVSRHRDYVRRFQREARAMSSLRHRNIVNVLDYGVERGRPFIAMEYLRGENLADWQDDLGRLPTLAEIRDVILPLCDAFEAAHKAGIVHRDLKPENIFLADEGDGQSRVLKVLDFGLARMDDDGEDATLTKASVVSGTPLYMSPEQCRSLANVGPATDLYAIGCVLTELLQGMPPFEGESHADVLTQQMFSAPPVLRRGPEAEPVSPLLERLRTDLLAKRPELRPPNVAALRARFLEALDPALAAARLPPRKNSEAQGGRLARVPEWTAPDAHVTTPPVGTLTGEVAILRLADEANSGLDSSALIGLSTSGLRLKVLTGGCPPGDPTLVVIDAGADVDGAVAWLGAHPGLAARTFVCVAAATGATLKQLIAAGVAEVIPYPVEIGALMSKVRRLLRRQRRRS
ncbi:MAG: serine/threonine-protein kinase [Myxococcota bacterium]